ncbi:MAG: GNAT family N-acetyltransferase [Gammaproteobacteria bacterium]
MSENLQRAGGSLAAVQTWAPSRPAKSVSESLRKLPQHDLHHEIVPGDSLGASPALVEEWTELARQVRAPPQQQPGWIEAWWSAFGTGSLEVHTVREDGRLIGVLPMARHRGILEAAANIHTPGFGVLADNPPSVADELAQALFSSEPRRISLIDLDPGGETFRAFMHAAHEAGYKVLLRPYQCSPYLQITEPWAEYERRHLGKKWLKNLRRQRRQLGREGHLSLEIADGSNRLEDLLYEAYKVEASSWKGSNGTAIVSDRRVRGFYTGLAQWAAAQGLLRLFFLRLDGRPIAMYYLLEQHGVCHLLKTGYDSNFRLFSPGKILTLAVLEHCFAGELTRVEFYGNGERFKFFWAHAAIERVRFEAFAPSMAGRLREAAFVYARPVAARLPTLGKRT